MIQFYVFVVAGLCAALLYGFYSFDRVIREQYENYRPYWEGAGKPHGICWHHSEGAGISSSWATNRAMFLWLFKTPDWVKQSQTAQVWLRRCRVSIFVWNAGLIVGFAIYLYRL